MKKFLAFFLLALLPFQSVWALAAEYCGKDEPVAQSTHFGHHEHADSHAAPAQPDNDGNADSGHSDCGVCQLAHGYTLTASVLSEIESGATPVLQSPPQHLPSARLTRPERPKWSPVV
ncbi:MAG: DUF2946 family protein [Betaproteobacteria bacterium]|nr:DUF2946 family protein [Betaproteobacteria bacterium]